MYMIGTSGSGFILLGDLKDQVDREDSLSTFVYQQLHNVLVFGLYFPIKGCKV